MDEHLLRRRDRRGPEPGPHCSIPGVYVAGAASGAKDIPESILHAGAAVAQAAAHLERGEGEGMSAV